MTIQGAAGDLDALLGIDPADPETALAISLVEGDYRLLRGLVELRRESGLTRRDIADRLGAAEADVEAFERYDSDPRLSTIRRYAHAVGASVGHEIGTPSAAASSSERP